MHLFALIPLAILLLPDLYIWWSFLHGATSWSRELLWWLPTLAAAGAFVLFVSGRAPEWGMKCFTGLFLCIAVPKLLFTLCSLAGRLTALVAPHAEAIGNVAGTVVALAACGIFLYGFTLGWKRLEVNEVEIAWDDLPASFDGYRIVQFSDLHAGAFGSNTRPISRLVGRIGALQPDLLLFTGDLVNIAPEELEPFGELLSQLQARDGIFSVAGNHDYCEYRHYDTPDGAARNFIEVMRRERSFGWQPLLNESHTIRRGTDSILLLGVENDGRPPFPSRGDLRKAMQDAPEGIFKILMSHDPTHWRREVLPDTDIRLTLSGHTHAMQFRLGRFSPSAWSYDEWGGLYREGERVLYVSTGVGGNLPFRFGAWPSIDVITLKKRPTPSSRQHLR